MEPLKVGDWVISTSWVNAEPNKITKIELATCQDEEDFVFFRENWCVELKYIQKWTQEPGEWCWFWDYLGFTPTIGIYVGKEKENFLADIPNGKGSLSLMSFKYCQPLIGDIPFHLKD